MPKLTFATETLTFWEPPLSLWVQPWMKSIVTEALFITKREGETAQDWEAGGPQNTLLLFCVTVQRYNSHLGKYWSQKPLCYIQTHRQKEEL